MCERLQERCVDQKVVEEGALVGDALVTVVYLDQPEIVKLLLEHGANPNTSPETSGSAVMHARRNPEVLALLLQYGAKEEPRPFEEIARLMEQRRLDQGVKRPAGTGPMRGHGRENSVVETYAGPCRS